MNILLYDSSSYIQKDLLYFLKEAGHHCKNIMYKLTDFYHDNFFEAYFTYYLRNGAWDFVMSANFYPIIADICHKNNIKYISWVYDSPIDTSDMSSFSYDTNYIYLFDRMDVSALLQKGLAHIYHLPLAVNTKRLNQIMLSPEDYANYSADISFVGQFYDNSLPYLLQNQNRYDAGYIDSIVQTQLRIYGYNFIKNMLSEELLQRINSKLFTDSNSSIRLTKEGLYQSICKEVTHIERSVLCNVLGQMYDVQYYSNQKQASLSHLTYGGTAYYYTEMPKIFKLSKLNLNPTLKTIQSGISLRVLDILGCRGALLCNYQLEIAEYFTNEKDVIMYDSFDDAIDKAAYYIKHNEKRTSIAGNGYQKAEEHFSYPDRLAYIFKTALQ